MRGIAGWMIAAFWLPVNTVAQAVPPEEHLEYSVNYPSGLPLGTAGIESRQAPLPDGRAGREFVFRLQAAVPGFEAEDRYRSLATAEYCSLEFEKDARHGMKVIRERMEFDPGGGMALRQDLASATQTKFETPPCAKDALTYLQYFRREMAAGRVPPPAVVYFGAAYQVRLEYMGRQRTRVGEESLDTERVQVTVKGPASEHSFQVFLALGSERTPVLFRVTLPQGLFLMELTQ
ncbi:MAG: DUF3108 domain-containing protein [Bryobacteraceae bacterium]